MEVEEAPGSHVSVNSTPREGMEGGEEAPAAGAAAGAAAAAAAAASGVEWEWEGEKEAAGAFLGKEEEGGFWGEGQGQAEEEAGGGEAEAEAEAEEEEEEEEGDTLIFPQLPPEDGGEGGEGGASGGKGGGGRTRGRRAAAPPAAAPDADPFALAIASVPLPAGKELQPVILHLDSLGCHKRRVLGALFRGWALREWCARRNGGQPLGGTAEAQRQAGKAIEALLPTLATDAPKQDNFCDCGVFVARYADLIMEATLPGGGWRRFTAADVAAARAGGGGAVPFPRGATRFSMADIAFLRLAMKEVIDACCGERKGDLVALSALRPAAGDGGDGVLERVRRHVAPLADAHMEHEKESHLRVAAPGLLFDTAAKKRVAADAADRDSDVEEMDEGEGAGGGGGGGGGGGSGPATKRGKQ